MHLREWKLNPNKLIYYYLFTKEQAGASEMLKISMILNFIPNMYGIQTPWPLNILALTFEEIHFTPLWYVKKLLGEWQTA